jgi:hypothetical protein
MEHADREVARCGPDEGVPHRAMTLRLQHQLDEVFGELLLVGRAGGEVEKERSTQGLEGLRVLAGSIRGGATKRSISGRPC